VLCQIGVGAFASAAIRFACHQTPPALALGVEPANAACATASLAAGRPVVVDAPGTSMAGLNCATPSHTAWPTLRDGLLGCVVISDEESRAAMRDLAGMGVVAGDCGAAPLAGLRALVRDPACGELARSAGLGPDSRVLLVSTEGITDPVGYAETMERT
jgi:diaminopropionate ammonia-lyase